MDPNTLNIITFAEEMAALVVQTITSLKSLIGGSSTQTTDEILADADTKYQSIIDKAKAGGVATTTPPVTGGAQ